jgi:hypothetical protein
LGTGRVNLKKQPAHSERTLSALRPSSPFLRSSHSVTRRYLPMRGFVMPIDVFQEQIVTFSQACRRLPRRRRDRPTHPATICRWATAGLRGHRLETALVGGMRVTSLEALSRFFAALSGPSTVDGRREESGTSESAERELAAEGL